MGDYLSPETNKLIYYLLGMKIYKKYTLLKDTPELKSGTVLYWDLWDERYTELSYTGNYKPVVSYKIEFIKSKPEWFLPVGKPVELYQPFPKVFEEEHFYFGKLRHNKMCRFCYDAGSILTSKEFKESVTKIFKELYEKKIKSLL